MSYDYEEFDYQQDYQKDYDGGYEKKDNSEEKKFDPCKQKNPCRPCPPPKPKPDCCRCCCCKKDDKWDDKYDKKDDKYDDKCDRKDDKWDDNKDNCRQNRCCFSICNLFRCIR